MFNGSIPIVLDTLKQHYFIDRDGKLFRYVLNFMRTGRLSLPLSFDDFDSLLEEAKYYEIDLMVKQIEEIFFKNNRNNCKKLEENQSLNGQSNSKPDSPSDDLVSSKLHMESAELSQRTKAKRTALILRTAFKSNTNTSLSTNSNTNSNDDDADDDEEVHMLNEEVEINTKPDNQSDLVVDENITTRKTSPVMVDEL